MGKNKIEKKEKRIMSTVKLFIEYNGNISDNELAKVLNESGIKTSSSSVGRDLLYNLEEYYYYINRKKYNLGDDEKYLDEEQERIVNFVKEKRIQNLKDAKKKGGNSSFEKNKYIKDEKGCFKGSKPRV